MEENGLNKYSDMFERIAEIIEKSKQRIVSTVNFEMVQCYYAIGKEIVEEEQKGSHRAEYGKALMENLAQQLTNKYGKGFSLRNLFLMRKFYLAYPILHTVSAKLSWTHYRQLMRIEDNNKRSFYEIETVENNCNMSAMRQTSLASLRDKGSCMLKRLRERSNLTNVQSRIDCFVMQIYRIFTSLMSRNDAVVYV
jgi:hypothetical protein